MRICRGAAVVLALAAGCSSSSHGSGTGGAGAAGSGGRTNTGGASASGGAVGTGGMTASGGAPGTGGAPGSGGTTASGGAPGSGGTTASGGAPGTGGAAGSGNGGMKGTGGSAGGSGGAANPNDVDVYLIGGQSNATGQGYAKNIPAAFVIDTKVLLYHSPGIVSGATANTWITLRPASEGTDGCNLGLRFGPELGFGNAIHAHYPDRPIYIIKHATTNTGLVVDWAPGASEADRGHYGPDFQTFVTTVNGGLTALKSMGKNPVIRAMLWQQGERDVDMGGTAASDYGKNLSAFIARVREQWNAPNMLFVYGFIYPASNFGTARDQVRKGQADVDQDSGTALATKGAFVVNGDTFSLRANDPGTCYPSDKIHFGSQGQLDLGKLMADEVHAHL